jgi:uncharacterized protein YecE (DUF72 family)
MDFGKLPSVDGLDLSLPPDGPHAPGVLHTPATPDIPRLYIGATGYNMKAWVGTWYPPGSRDREFLRHYGAQFNTIEHNTTHYRIPDLDTVQRWRSETPDDFRFCPKIPQTISHSRDLGLNGPEIQIFCEQITGLGPKNGCCFMQLPPHVGPASTALLRRFFRQWPSNTPLALEMRHPDFFNGNPAAEEVFDLLQEHHISTVITDVAGRRDVLHMRLTTPVAMVRFVGNGLHPSDYTRIRDWAQRLRDWCAQGLQTVYFFTHEPDNLLAPELAAFCTDTFREYMPQALLRGPRPVGGVQGTLF